MKKPYEAPEIRIWGSIADLTKTGGSLEGNDLKDGSVASPGQ